MVIGDAAQRSYPQAHSRRRLTGIRGSFPRVELFDDFAAHGETIAGGTIRSSAST